MKNKTVILANGEFPTHGIPLQILNNANQIICCDGATNNLLNYGLKPDLIIGDLDSVSREIKNEYSHILIHDTDQNTNDLTKAVNWCIKQHITEIVILGATGKREDHSIGNISLISNYIESIQVTMFTNYGILSPIIESTTFNSYKGQQVSIFSLTPNTPISSINLKYPLDKYNLDSWWKGTLNESLDSEFSLNFENGKLIVFQEYLK
ncbi:MAG TPA: thiamine diphosphokinase [Bacteroidales bacterium]|nr:MAG: thiamine diphosphokinase [Bacteroidetes bacterium GWF2_33_38]OFY68269.1 MAG: thiamine diphosphokinase [Bacteroidetes bacterium RIFOXYA12_FULL_33_9]HBF87296.1 thiamine diphosphokinase [Bacteroidales bacterium]